MFSILAAGLVITSSCTKTGPVGPQGPTGATGNSNVIGSNHITVSAWEHSSASTYSALFSYADITAAVAAYGLVEIYKQYSDGSWTNLPDINGITSTVFNFSTGTFTIYVVNTDGSTPVFPGTLNFRVVVIPSSVKTANPTTNWNNYNEAIDALNKSKATNTNY